MRENAQDIAVRYTAELSLMEIGLGSFLHSFRIPFSGHLLSLNQCFLLNRAVMQTTAAPFLPMTISNTAAILKTLSPRGKRFTPMLAITMQGLFFNMGTLLFGAHFPGRCIASMLLSFWPMLQPLIIYGIILGGQFGNLISFYNNLFAKVSWLNGFYLQHLLIGLVLVNLLLSFMVSLLATYIPLRWLEKYQTKFIAYPKPAGQKKSQKLIPKELYSFSFLVTMTMCFIFFYATLNSVNEIFYAQCRVLGLAYVTFVILKNIPAEWFLKFLQQFRFVNLCAPHIEEVWNSIRKD